ncbi:hypothetical protein ACP4OV_018891 [Aristida adscensionis]
MGASSTVLLFFFLASIFSSVATGGKGPLAIVHFTRI